MQISLDLDGRQPNREQSDPSGGEPDGKAPAGNRYHLPPVARTLWRSITRQNESENCRSMQGNHGARTYSIRHGG